MTQPKPPTQGAKRKRLSVDLEAYPDVKRMMERAMNKNGGKPTDITIDALRDYLTKLGFAGKKDLAAV